MLLFIILTIVHILKIILQLSMVKKSVIYLLNYLWYSRGCHFIHLRFTSTYRVL